MAHKPIKEIVLRKIKDAAKAEAIELDLSLSDLRFAYEEIPVNYLATVLSGIRLPDSLRLLNISYVKLSTLPAEITKLTNLTSLNLAGNQFSNLPIEIENLINLTSLNLSENMLTALPVGLWKLNNLISLDLSRNQLTSLPVQIDHLTNLRILHLFGNGLENLCSEIGRLLNLELIDLGGNNLTTVPAEISQLANLKKLNIGYNDLRYFRSTILNPRHRGNRPDLFTTHLFTNRLAELPTEISRLSKLEFLNVNGHSLTELPRAIGYLFNLRELYAKANNISTIPAEIGQSHKLQILDLSSNELTALPTEIGDLISLQELDISHNPLISLPAEIGQLKNLKILIGKGHRHVPLFAPVLVDTHKENASNKLALKVPVKPNELTSKPRFRRARSPRYEGPGLTVLPSEIKHLTNLEHLNLQDQSLPIPPEILYKTDKPQTILNYYFSVVEQKRKPLNELKIVFIGQGSVGKTSLIQYIQLGTFDYNQIKTTGISINQWQMADMSNSRIRLNIWDFGGQEIMHATHQFFLTKRSLYLLVLDSRLTQEENRVEYWLKIIQSFGGESAVLIVGNKVDQHPLDIDRTGLQKKYPNIVGILETSAATGAGIEELKATITMQVNDLPHVRDLLPETWFTVKTKLEGLGRESNFITYDKYIELCAENEVTDETSQRTLIGFLHDLGVVLHFQDDPRLEALGILNPQWVTNGVYKILNSHTLFQNKGVLTVSMLDEILNLPEYPRGKRLFIVDMMKKFELCYDIEADKTFLVPDLLPKDEPAELKFNGVPAFEYMYPVLPSSVITRLIVRMNQKIDDGLVWRTGVVLKIGENTALVKADIEDRKITIAIDGLEHTRRDALSAIRYQLDEIHGSIKGLNPEKRVPIPEAPNAEPLEYEYLLMLEREGQETHLVKDGNRLVKFNVRQLLSGIVSETERKEDGGRVTNIYIGGDVKGSTIIAGDENEVKK
jgi:internalin A